MEYAEDLKSLERNLVRVRIPLALQKENKMQNKRTTKPIFLRLSPEVEKKLRTIANNWGCTLGQVIDTALTALEVQAFRSLAANEQLEEKKKKTA